MLRYKKFSSTLLFLIATLGFFCCNEAFGLELYQPMDATTNIGCGAGKTHYPGFTGCYFRTHGTNSYNLEDFGTGPSVGTGIGGSNSWRIVGKADIPESSQTSHFWQVSLSRATSHYYRVCQKYTSGWLRTDNSTPADQKLTYMNYTGPPEKPLRDTLFIHAFGAEQTCPSQPGGKEFAWYDTTNSWIVACSTINQVQHTNHLRLNNYIDDWICWEEYVNVSGNPWQHRIWITTEEGYNSCNPGQACNIDGTVEFNDYEYFRFTTARAANSIANIEFGHYSNEQLPEGGVFYEDEFVASTNKIGPPTGLSNNSDAIAPSAPGGLIVQ